MKKYLGYTEEELLTWDKEEAPKFDEMCKKLEGETLKKYKRKYMIMTTACGAMYKDQTIDIVPNE